MSSPSTTAQSRYRARSSLKLSFFDRMDAERVRGIRRTFPQREPSPEERLVQHYLLNHPGCYAGIECITVRTLPDGGGPIWTVRYSAAEPNARFCAAVALAALCSVSSFVGGARSETESFGTDDAGVRLAAQEIADLKRLGLWGRHE